jgi:hypothetical protein
MTGNLHTDLHARAQEFFAKSLVEEISSADRTWLDRHLCDCPDCASEVLVTQNLLGALRSVPVSVPRDLAARTQLRVRLRAQENSPTPRSSGILLWLITGMSWVLGIFSAPLVWRAFSWVGGHLSIPKLALQMGFVLWWVVPALFAVGAILHQKALAPASSHGQRRG